MMTGVLVPAAILGINIVYVAHTENNGFFNKTWKTKKSVYLITLKNLIFKVWKKSTYFNINKNKSYIRVYTVYFYFPIDK